MYVMLWDIYLLLLLFFLYYVGGNQAHGPPGLRQSPWPMDACNTRGMTRALPTPQKPISSPFEEPNTVYSCLN